jgi:aminopeptidase S
MPAKPSNRHARGRQTLRGIGVLALAALGVFGSASHSRMTHAQTPSTQTTNPNAAPSAHTDTAWYRDILEIAAAKDNPGRRFALRTRLQRAGFEVASVKFKTRYGEGENLLAPVTGAKDLPLLLIGAHSDRTRRGSGAVDNATGCAIAIALAERLRAHPLRKYRVAVAFWDLEEPGLHGSKAYIADGGERPALYVNLDVLAWGDTMWMMTPDAAHALVESSGRAARDHGFAFYADKRHPPSDHLAFYNADWPAVSYMLTDGGEIPTMLRVLANEKVSFVPKHIATIHSRHDSVDKLEPATIARGINALEAALRDWDAKDSN